jgi:predicted dehydrogenase
MAVAVQCVESKEAMKKPNQITRRSFVKGSALAAGVFVSAPFNILSAENAGEKVRFVQIGCGGRANEHLKNTMNEHCVALVEVDDRKIPSVKKSLQDKGKDAEKIQVFTDYRKMFDKVGKEIDAVFIATPNHQHALPSLIAMQLNKAVYCEKPVCHDIGEARAMRAAAAKSKAATQMGNQGHCEEGYRKLCEYIWAGVIGKVTETHSWTDRANGGEGPRPPKKPAPEGMHWEEWIGPAPYRDFHDDLHPHSWHGWYDFGNGSIGNMGCHVLDGVYWALKCEHPTSIEVEQLRGGSDERYPMGSRVRWDIPARGDMPAFKAYWYEGLNATTTGRPQGNLRKATGADRNLPQLLIELREKYPDEELDRGDSGTLYVGEKGVIFTGTYGDRMHIVPYEKMNETKAPAKTLPRPKSVFVDFLDAVRAGKKETAVSFEYGTQLTEFALLGNLAMKAGANKKVEWDGKNMKVTNIPELNAWVKRPYRDGWKV